MPLPLVQLQADNIGQRGEGIARYQGMPVFIPGLLPGEKALVQITEQKKTYFRGEIVDLLESSPERCQPFCDSFPQCGGCQLQHWDYTAQLAWKRRNIVELFRRQAKLEVEVLPVIAATEPMGTRNKVQLPFGVNDGAIQIGFYRTRSHQVVNLTHCPMQSELANRALQVIGDILVNQSLSVYDEINHCGLLRHLLLRTNREDTQILVILVINGRELPGAAGFIQQLRDKLPELAGFSLNVNQCSGNTILGQESILLWGSSELLDSIGEFSYYVSGSSFFQTNRLLTETLYKMALQQAALQGEELVLEAYCGTGTISVFLAQQAREVIAVELHPQAIRDAYRNATMNNMCNIRFIEGASEVVLPELLAQGLRPDLVLVDPPRQGCSPELLTAVARAKIPRFLYISCNPATLARDAALLHAQGYYLGPIQPVDMFPWTEHVECVMELRRLET